MRGKGKVHELAERNFKPLLPWTRTLWEPVQPFERVLLVLDTGPLHVRPATPPEVGAFLGGRGAKGRGKGAKAGQKGEGRRGQRGEGRRRRGERGAARQRGESTAPLAKRRAAPPNAFR